MEAYMTNGTLEFIKKLIDKHPGIDFYLMNSGGNALAYYENNNENVFESGRAYDVLLNNGTIQEKGFVVMNNITVTEDGRTVFEDRFKQRSSTIDSSPGFQAFRLLRPQSGNKYVVLTQWASVEDFNNWKNSDAFKKQHQNGGETKPPAYFADKPYITSYNMVEPE
ncbi:antibiotic biosynthesis monooxygenase family protein [Virgibacillus necropolis]|uniref:Antibiotic biosynthesis monooxygenase n=1 Tax=Virgibacillus necropolis TaxID=163877 RepID=A0A221MG15_9BACI|nr:antibiotic biosynthesis monooxygenase [Virgibacillus necropolis]ASN06571.1 antibiotic biosynthesis monooxygenase [Virgibacillus necropolis]